MPYFKFQKIIFQTLKKIISNPYFNFASSKKKKKNPFFQGVHFFGFASLFWSCEFTSPINGILEKEFFELAKI